MYDVMYVDGSNHRSFVAQGLCREDAADLARCEARRRRVGRMFMAGSEPQRDIVLIVESAWQQS